MRTLIRRSTLVLIALAAGCGERHADAPPLGPVGPELVVAAELGDHCNGAVTSPDGRLFVNFPHAGGGVGVKIAEVTDGHTVVPYPDPAWNGYAPDKAEPDDAARKFVGTNSLRFGPDGKLWVVDTGCTAPGGKPVPGGAKLVAIDVTTNAVVRTVPLDAVLKPDSFVDDVRFHGGLAYLSDAGHPAIIVLDLTSGRGRRVLEDDPSTTARRPMRAVGHALTKFDGTPAKLHADQLEVSPDGRTFYFQPCPGPMVQVETRYLDDASLPAAELAAHVRPFADTPTSGGTCIDAAGVIYLNDADRSRIVRLTPDGQMTTLVQDDRLHWGDAVWIADGGDLIVPAAQMDRSATFNRGVEAVQLPVRVYRMGLGLKPLRN